MSTTTTGSGDVARRAARHAALADPARLQVVDLLALGDASPGELRTALGMPSNLLAHHLNVLAEAGLVTRSRSEGDRRRSYVRLDPTALDALVAAAPATAAGRVVFVCTANSARSRLAEALWQRRSAVPVTSAGTHPAARVADGARAVADRRGLALPAGPPRPLGGTLTADDLVVTVCDAAHEELGHRAALHWSVPDPVRTGTAAAFDAAFDDLARRVDRLTDHVLAA